MWIALQKFYRIGVRIALQKNRSAKSPDNNCSASATAKQGDLYSTNITILVVLEAAEGKEGPTTW